MNVCIWQAHYNTLHRINLVTILCVCQYLQLSIKKVSEAMPEEEEEEEEKFDSTADDTSRKVRTL